LHILEKISEASATGKIVPQMDVHCGTFGGGWDLLIWIWKNCGTMEVDVPRLKVKSAAT